MLVSKVFTFDSAHQLTDYHGECENLHGHTFRLTVTVENRVQKDGMAFDFVLLKNVVREKIIARLDHTYLNDLMPNPSAENLAIWIWDELAAALPVALHEIQLGETPTSFVTYRGEDSPKR
jgi:6-pyruvoyltetrahydropterin/6-carboxytetrahydropterin synthase